ncbi:hypothetical protein [Nonomuraea sp. NPDC050310]|uniref:hypothetical protein n=1 Tax=unclassified Nonomuraea TaxID=2593643 RepID=UPI0033FD7007
MQTNDVRLLKAAAIPAVAVGALVVAVCAVVSGVPGLLGALIGTALVLVFFSISVFALGYASRISPTFMMAAAMGTYLVKALALILALSSLEGVTAWSPKAFTWAVIVCTVMWTLAEARAVVKLKMLYVDPEGKVPGHYGDKK